jgi:predicted NBD/HSP70 family sugar kinase
VALAGLVNLVNPEVVVIGGQLSKVGAVIIEPMLTALERCAIPSAAASVTLRPAELDTDADVVGALVTAQARHLADSAVGLAAITS